MIHRAPRWPSGQASVPRAADLGLIASFTQNLSPGAGIMEVRGRYHGGQGPVSWRSGADIMEVRGRYHGGQGPVSWRSGAGIMEVRGRYHGGQGPVSWRSGVGIMEVKGRYNGGQGQVSWRSGVGIMEVRGRYHGGRRPSSDDSLHSPTVIPPSALHKPSVMKCYHRRRTCSHTSSRRSLTMVTLHDTRFVECRW